jgi:RNA polymerase sigma factor (sigma-70 family)
MENPPIARILERLVSQEFQQAWTEFLESYSLHILQTVRLFERDADPVADCFLFVCEALTEKGFRRLRSFKLDGSAQFTTWLRVVVRNLCLDWHRKEFGRHRVFQSIARLGTLDQEIFRCVYEQGLSQDESLNFLRANHPQLTLAEFDAGMGRVRGALTDRQIWLAGARRQTPLPLERDPEAGPEELIPEPIDPAPNIESMLVMNEQRAALERALGRLAKPERLLIKLRFEQGLTLQEIAPLMGLKDAQTVDRRQRDIVEKLRKELADFSGPRGKS